MKFVGRLFILFLLYGLQIISVDDYFKSTTGDVHVESLIGNVTVQGSQIDVTATDGPLNLIAQSGDVNIQASGNMNINTSGMVNFAADLSINSLVGDPNLPLSGANAVLADTAGGNVSITSGDGMGTGAGGDIILVAGESTGTGSGGRINLTTGGSSEVGTESGDIGLVAAGALNAVGSTVDISSTGGTLNLEAAGGMNIQAAGLLNIDASSSVFVDTPAFFVLNAALMNANTTGNLQCKSDSYIRLYSNGAPGSGAAVGGIYVNASNDLDLTCESGDINVEASGDVNIFASGEINVLADKGTYPLSRTLSDVETSLLTIYQQLSFKSARKSIYFNSNFTLSTNNVTLSAPDNIVVNADTSDKVSMSIIGTITGLTAADYPNLTITTSSGAYENIIDGDVIINGDLIMYNPLRITGNLTVRGSVIMAASPQAALVVEGDAVFDGDGDNQSKGVSLATVKTRNLTIRNYNYNTTAVYLQPYTVEAKNVLMENNQSSATRAIQVAGSLYAENDITFYRNVSTAGNSGGRAVETTSSGDIIAKCGTVLFSQNSAQTGNALLIIGGSKVEAKDIIVCDNFANNVYAADLGDMTASNSIRIERNQAKIGVARAVNLFNTQTAEAIYYVHNTALASQTVTKSSGSLVQYYGGGALSATQKTDANFIDQNIPYVDLSAQTQHGTNYPYRLQPFNGLTSTTGSFGVSGYTLTLTYDNSTGAITVTPVANKIINISGTLTFGNSITFTVDVNANNVVDLGVDDQVTLSWNVDNSIVATVASQP